MASKATHSSWGCGGGGGRAQSRVCYTRLLRHAFKSGWGGEKKRRRGGRRRRGKDRR